jgi:hypothetical protein
MYLSVTVTVTVAVVLYRAYGTGHPPPPETLVPWFGIGVVVLHCDVVL